MRSIEQLGWYDDERRHLMLQPLGWRVWPRLSLAGDRIFDKSLPVEYELPSVQLIVEHAVQPLTAGVDRRGIVELTRIMHQEQRRAG